LLAFPRHCLSFPKIRSGPDSHPEAESSHHPGDACDPALARMFVGDLFKSRCLLEAENLFLRHQLSIACDILRAPIPGQKLVDALGRDNRASTSASQACRSSEMASDQIGAYTISIIVIGSATDAIPVPHLYALREHARHAPDF
jgi:hypothetical protein